VLGKGLGASMNIHMVQVCVVQVAGTCRARAGRERVRACVHCVGLGHVGRGLDQQSLVARVGQEHPQFESN
jgi:hypothetical protein